MSDGSRIEANQKIDGGPSVLYDAVALLVSEEGAEMLAKQAAARDFVADAFAHSKFIANSDSAKPLLSKIIAADKLDDSFIEIREGIEASKLVRACGKLRFRECHVARRKNLWGAKSYPTPDNFSAWD
jgi:catalase